MAWNYSRVGTKVFRENGYVNVQYHNTVVVAFNDDEIILNTGGWFTKTTKVRMNQASSQYSLGYQVYQKKHNWFVSYRGKIIPFDGNSLKLQR